MDTPHTALQVRKKRTKGQRKQARREIELRRIREEVDERRRLEELPFKDVPDFTVESEVFPGQFQTMRGPGWAAYEAAMERSRLQQQPVAKPLSREEVLRRQALQKRTPSRKQESSSDTDEDEYIDYRMGDELLEPDEKESPAAQFMVESDIASTIESDDGKRRYDIDENEVPPEIPAPVPNEEEESVEVDKPLPTPRDPPAQTKIKKRTDTYEEEESQPPPAKRSITRLSPEDQDQ
jgi:hypothetical protein